VLDKLINWDFAADNLGEIRSVQATKGKS